jgi:TonB family protein
LEIGNVAFRAALKLVLVAIIASFVLTAAPLAVPEGQAKKAAIRKPSPALSPMARQLNVSGHVELAVEIGEDGSVTDVKPVSGNPILAAGAVAAVKEWKFTPFEQGGAPTKATTTLSFDFKQ